MAGGLLALRWNNHSSTFLHVLSNLRHKDSYCDATLACEGIFYPVHKIVLSTCSEYFDEIFQRTQCKHPVIILKDVKPDDLEALLNYMYLGEVNVLQDRLSGLIKNAENLKIKGLAVPDDEPPSNTRENKRNSVSEKSPPPKRRRPDKDVDDDKNSRLHNNTDPEHNSDKSDDGAKRNSDSESPSKRRLKTNSVSEDSDKINRHRKQDVDHQNDEAVLIKDEPSEVEDDDDKIELHSQLGFNALDDGGEEDNEFGMQGMVKVPPSIEDVLGQAMPGPSGLQSNMWDGDGSLSGGLDSYNNDPSHNRQPGEHLTDTSAINGPSFNNTSTNTKGKLTKVETIHTTQSHFSAQDNSYMENWAFENDAYNMSHQDTKFASSSVSHLNEMNNAYFSQDVLTHRLPDNCGQLPKRNNRYNESDKLWIADLYNKHGSKARYMVAEYYGRPLAKSTFHYILNSVKNMNNSKKE